MTTTANGATQSVLTGIRVLDLSGLAGQYAGRLLADLGADVIKIEPPGGDPVRSMPPFAGDEPGPDRSLRWLAYNTNKSSVVIDIETDSGRQQLLDMARSADVVLDSFEPGYLASIGLPDEALREANPRLITVSVTPFGESGPYGGYLASDLHAIAMSGLITIQGDDEQPPATAPLDQAYILANTHAAHGVFYALMARRKTGRGQHVEVSMQEVLANIFYQIIRYSATSEIGERIGATGNLAPYNIYQCKDGWVSLAVLLAPQAKVFFDWMGEPALQNDFFYPLINRQGENMIFIDSLVRPFIEQFTVAEFVEEAQSRRLPAAPVNRPGDFADN
ncbi:MAG: CoA transferase, partial [Dehalococcoidia bacterium]|nr:CoA transferase [Dehalococcoidia bacterium]